MEGRPKVTKEVLCEEARFILANVMAEARYGRQNRFDDIRRVCEGAVSIPFGEYVGFLEKSGYLRHDRSSETLEVTPDGEAVVNGANLGDFTERAVAHFKKLRQSRAMAAASPTSIPVGTQAGALLQAGLTPPALAPGAAVTPTQPPMNMTATPVRDAPPMIRKDVKVAGTARSEYGNETERYEKLAPLGAGGIGTVFRARQVALQRDVALKELRELFTFFSEEQRPEIVRRFSDVVRAAASLAHPNILPIHDVSVEREFPFVVMELAPNGSCRRLINDAEDVPVELVFKYLLQTLHALRAAHMQKVFHRGLKPEQLLIDAYGNIKVSDFGMSRIVERDSAVVKQIYVGLGNVAYMAPELYNDPALTGPQSDIYALGIIFYELLTRKLPGRRSPMPSQVNPQLPKGIDDIFDRMTRDSRDERYATVDDILADIDRLEGLDGVLDRQHQVLAVDSPLSAIKFRSSGEESDGEEVDGKGVPRPYSFQQRRNKKL